jgi:hypothetical protein
MVNETLLGLGFICGFFACAWVYKISERDDVNAGLSTEIPGVPTGRLDRAARWLMHRPAARVVDRARPHEEEMSARASSSSAGRQKFTKTAEEEEARWAR